jgi:hypothetical protein
MPSQEKLAEFVTWCAKKVTGDENGQLLALNLEVAQRIDQAQPVTAPGIPANYPDPKNLVTDDCIKPPAI